MVIKRKQNKGLEKIDWCVETVIHAGISGDAGPAPHRVDPWQIDFLHPRSGVEAMGAEMFR